MSKKKNKNKNIKTDYSSVLDKYNIRHYEDDYVIIGKFCNMSIAQKIGLRLTDINCNFRQINMKN